MAGMQMSWDSDKIALLGKSPAICNSFCCLFPATTLGRRNALEHPSSCHPTSIHKLVLQYTRLSYNSIMIMNIKLDYKNKLHSIGKDIHSLQQIAEAIRLRYPADFKYGVIAAVIDNGNHHQVKTFEEIVDFWNKSGSGASVKVKVFEAPENTELKQEIKQIILQSADPTYTESVYEAPSYIKQSKVPEKSAEFDVEEYQDGFKLLATNPFLKNKDLDESMDVATGKMLQKEVKSERDFQEIAPLQACKIQKDAGLLDPHSPLFKAINQMVEDKVKSILQQYGIFPKQQKIGSLQKSEVIKDKKQEQKIVEPSMPRVDKDLLKFDDVKVEEPLKPERPKEQIRQYKVKVTASPLNHIICEPSAGYSWKVNFTNCGTAGWPKTVSVYKTSNKIVEITQVKPLSPGSSAQITLDLVAPSAIGVESREFRLGYINENSDNLIFFGPKFGFELETKGEQKKAPVAEKKEQQQDSELIKSVSEAAKKVVNQRHGIKMLVKYIKQTGFDCGLSKEMLVEVITQLQGQKLA